MERRASQGLTAERGGFGSTVLRRPTAGARSSRIIQCLFQETVVVFERGSQPQTDDLAKDRIQDERDEDTLSKCQPLFLG